MNEIAKVISGCFLVVALASPALAHHSAAAYDTQKEVRLTGTITQYRFGNPHVYMILQVKKADGSTNSVEVEAGAASVLNPLGFKKDALAAGDVVTVVGNPGRDNPDKFVLGKDLYKQDGSYIPLNIASRSIYTSNSNETASISWRHEKLAHHRKRQGCHGRQQ